VTTFRAGPGQHPPADAVDPFQWLTGFALRELHSYDPKFGGCVTCGLPGRHCPFFELGYEVSRQALADPDTLPRQPPT
jgi:hypothetical protein